MATQQELLIKIKGDIGDIQSKLGNIQKQVDKSESKFKGLQKTMVTIGKVGAAAIGGLGAAFGGLAAIGLKYNSDMENYMSNFTVLLGDAEKATKHVEDLKKMASKTPFEMTDLAEASKTLLAFGVDAEETQGILQMLGDVSLGNKEKFNSLALVFGQVSSAGKMTGQDLMQMINAGFNPLNVISQKTGESMESLKDRMSKGAIGIDEVTQAFQWATEEGGQFAGGMEKASETVSGKLSTLKDNVNSLLGDAFEPLYKMIADKVLPFLLELVGKIQEGVDEFQKIYGETGNFTDALQGLLDKMGATGLSDFIEKIQSIPEKLKEWEQPLTVAAVLLGGLATAITVYTIAQNFSLITTALGVAGLTAWSTVCGIASAATSILAGVVAFLTSPITLVILAITALIAIGYLLVKNWDEVSAWLKETWESIKAKGVELWNSLKEFFSNTWNSIKETASNTWNSIKEFFSGLWDSIKTKAVNAWDNLKTSISNVWNDTISWVKEKANGLITFFTELPGKLLSIGSDIINGLWNGLKNAWGNVVSWVSEKANWIADKFKGILGIHSPSRVFMEIGGYVDEGLVKGLEDGEVDINSQVTGMAEGLKSGFNSSFNDGSETVNPASSNNTTVNLNGSYMFQDKDSMDYFLNKLGLAVQRG